MYRTLLFAILTLVMPGISSASTFTPFTEIPQRYEILLHTALQDPPTSRNPNNEYEARYLLIHVDGVSADHFRQEWEAGRLPRLKHHFGDDGWIPDAITYLPSKTPIVISSVRTSTPIQESPLVSWVGEDRRTGQPFGGTATLRDMLRSKSRLGMANLLYGIPSLSWLNIVATRNLPALSRHYPSLEYYWYPIDTYGHFDGESSYLEQMHRLDHHIGHMLDQLDPEINILLYSDHGMAFGEGVSTDDQLRERFGDETRTASYPNIYLEREHKELDHPSLALRMLDETDLDFIFYQDGEGQIIGHHSLGTMIITQASESHHYQYRFQGEDPLGFYEAGYQGEFWSHDEWLEFSYTMDYPAAPPQLHHLLSNNRAGDLVGFLEAGKYNQTDYSEAGNHGGFTREELSIPILFRGPNLQSLSHLKTLSLDRLMHRIGSPDFDRKPRRDPHTLSISHGFRASEQRAALTLSPGYRWQLGGELHFRPEGEGNRYNAWLVGDIFRSYIARVWVGAGLQARETGKAGPDLHLIHELRYQRFHLQSHVRTHSRNRFTLSVDLGSGWAFEVVNLREAGLRVRL